VRNSSLVERDCAENVTGLKHGTETGNLTQVRVVGERSGGGEGSGTTVVGASRSENAGISSENSVRTRVAKRLRVPTEGQSTSG
jgi:hypothetical protein